MKKETIPNELLFLNTKTNIQCKVKGDLEFLLRFFDHAMKTSSLEILHEDVEIYEKSRSRPKSKDPSDLPHANLIEFIHQKEGYKKA